MLRLPEPTARSIEAMYAYAQWKKPVPVYELPNATWRPGKAVVEAAPSRGQHEIVEFQAREARRRRVSTPGTVKPAAATRRPTPRSAWGFPVALKVAYVDLAQDRRGRRGLGLADEAAVRQVALGHHQPRPAPAAHAYIAGCLVQQMAPKRQAQEVIVGFKRDEQFGPLPMFGLGGHPRRNT